MKRKLMIWFYKHLLFVMLCVVIGLFLLNLLPFFLDESRCGAFGDQFGAANALFSGLAFVGLIYTIMLQRKDLKMQRHELCLQRKELEMTRDEMKRQTEQQELQTEMFSVQRFENTFFQMLLQYQEVVNNLTFSFEENGKIEVIKGRELFFESFESVPHHTFVVGMEPIKVDGMRGLLEKKGMDGYMESNTPTYFDHYFRLLYRILKFVQSTNLITDFEKEYEYTSMLRALLSRYELVWLYYNGLSKYGCDKLKPLIERYAMLKNLREEFLVADLKNLGAYNQSAYEKILPKA